MRDLQPWRTRGGPCLQVADCVPETPPRRQWAETFPWAALVAAVGRSCAQRFPTPRTRGRPPSSTRVLWALERLQQEVAGADEQSGSRLRTDVAVMDAGGLGKVKMDGAQEPVVLPAVRAHLRRRRAAP